MERPQVSIIVPVYKVESFLPKCIESIQNQTYKNWELILVDDGSPDNSGKVCDEYAKGDSRIRVLHKENGGVSSARNLGLENIKGEWVTFVDADDWLDANTLEQCMTFQDYDLIRFSANFVYNEDGSRNIPYELSDKLTKEEFLEKIVGRKILLSVWGCVLRSSLFENEVKFNTTLTNGEDWLVLVSLVSKANRIKIINKPFYQYNRYNENSCVANLTKKKILESINALDCISDIIDSIKYNKAICTAMLKLACLAIKVDNSTDVFHHKYLRFVDIFSSDNTIKEKLFVGYYRLIFQVGKILNKITCKTGNI